MCSIFGALLGPQPSYNSDTVNLRLACIAELSTERGRDGRGFVSVATGTGREWTNFMRSPQRVEGDEIAFARQTFVPKEGYQSCAVIGNCRAEPTTEYVSDKCATDQQPYRAGRWAIVHNGTIANDKELRTDVVVTTIDSAAIVEQLHKRSAAFLVEETDRAEEAAEVFGSVMDDIKGSYAILAVNYDLPDRVFVACNYRPVWYCIVEGEGVYFASAKEYLPEFGRREMLTPYSQRIFELQDGIVTIRTIKAPRPANKRALVVCSGGLDSVVALSQMLAKGYDCEMLHFRYGSRAEGPEVAAVHAVANHFAIPLHVMPIPIYKPEHSPLLQADSAIAGGEAGAEFAHEWVPARNLVMLSIATAMAEAMGIETIVLGNNLEEAGAYPDNEPEFVKRFGEVLPFAVGDGKQVQVVMPVGNLMKHEIVKLGHQLDAPLHLTWSCYRSGPTHCGKCGPCHMRKTAFEINSLDEVIQYTTEGE